MCVTALVWRFHFLSPCPLARWAGLDETQKRSFAITYSDGRVAGPLAARSTNVMLHDNNVMLHDNQPPPRTICFVMLHSHLKNTRNRV